MPSKSDYTYDVCFIHLGIVSNDARTLNIARTLAKHGKKVCVIAEDPGSEKEYLAGQGIELFPVDSSEDMRLRKRWLRFTRGSKKYFKEAAASSYWAMDMYSLVPGSRLSRKYSARLFYDSREIYSALGPLSGNPLKQKIISAIEKHYVRDVDHFIVSGELDAEYLKKAFNTDKPFDVIMNLPPYKEHEQADLFRENYGIGSDQKIMLYQGVILPGRGLARIIDAMPGLPEYVLCILGEGEYKETLKKQAEDLGVSPRVIFCGRLPYDELHSWTCSADLGLSYNEPISYSYELALPNKLFEYCMARIPSLVSDLPALRQFVEKYGIGDVVFPNAPKEELASAIRCLTSSKDREKYFQNCGKAAKVLNYEAQEERIMNIVDIK